MQRGCFQLGPLVFSIEGNGPVFEAFFNELSVLPGSQEEPRIGFIFKEELAKPRALLKVGGWELGDHFVSAQRHGYDFAIQTEGERWEVFLSPHKRNQVRGIRRKFKQTWDWNYLTPAETTAKNIMYNLFDLVTGAAMLPLGSSYLHASTASKLGRGLAFVAWGGVGKTTSILKLVRERQWKFLSDDLGLLSQDGTLYRTPKKLQIYAYNVEGEEGLRRDLLQGRGARDLVNWHWRMQRFGPKKVRRRVAAEEFLGPQQVGTTAVLDEVIFLERRELSQFQWEDIDGQELARRSAAILVDELNTLFELAIVADSHGVITGLGHFDELREYSRTIQAKAFERLKDTPRKLAIPVRATPEELLQELENRGK